MSQDVDQLAWWSSLRHGGMLLDLPRLTNLLAQSVEQKSLSGYEQDRFRRTLVKFVDDPTAHRTEFVKYVLEQLCGFDKLSGVWQRGSAVGETWTCTGITGESIRPSHLWIGINDSVLPVFIDNEKRIGIGRGVRIVSQALQWMRKTNNRLGLVTNGDQWRILYAGLSYEAFVEWDQRQWLSSGEPTPELEGLRSLLQPRRITAPSKGATSPFVDAVNDSRKGQADLSEILGERVRQAAELLIQGHTAAIADPIAKQAFTPQELYRSAVRIIMRMVIVLFAESREGLLPRDNPIYFHSYSLGGLREMLERIHTGRLRNSYSAYPRFISLCRLIFDGSSHESLIVRAYGGQLFEPGNPTSAEGQSRALAVLETGCYEFDVMNDQQVHQILNLLSRTKIRLRQGRQNTWVAAPVDFSSLESEYIGILYEGLLDFELRQAANDNPVVFLAVGNQPALPLATLEAMDDKALKNLLEKMKDSSTASDDANGDAESNDSEIDATDSSDDAGANADSDSNEENSDAADLVESEEASDLDDNRLTARTRAENWARRAIAVGNLVTKPRGTLNNERRLQYEASIDRKARQIITKVVLPGEWYLVRWGGTRKGSGTFYTKPQLAIPTVVRTLQPLVYFVPDALTSDVATDELVSELPGEYAENPTSKKKHSTSSTASQSTKQSDLKAPQNQPSNLIPRNPEQILALKVCDPACGSGTFPLNALRYLTEALYESLQYYKRIQYHADRTVIDLIVDEQSQRMLAGEMLPCRPDDNDFEVRTKAVLKRYIVERCIYGVDLDPLAVELCRLSLWIETLDPRLPFTFLDHKIKCGNSLIGTWFDQFMHYPAMAWMREGGDKSHSNGVHFKKEQWSKAITARIPDVRQQLIDYIDAQLFLNTGEDLDTVQTVHDDAEKELARIHNLGIHEADERAIAYQRLRQSKAFVDAKFSLDLWCSIWFWPPESILDCPLPKDFYAGQLPTPARQIVNELSDSLRYFHWQLEFPDVFSTSEDGFDVVLGNPPWDIASPIARSSFQPSTPCIEVMASRRRLRNRKKPSTYRLAQRSSGFDTTLSSEPNPTG